MTQAQTIAAGLTVTLVMQDGQPFTTTIPDTVHNRQFQSYVARHESYALAVRAVLMEENNV